MRRASALFASTVCLAASSAFGQSRTVNLWNGPAPGSEAWTQQERVVTDTPQLMRNRFATTGRVPGGQIVQDGVTAAGSMIDEWGHADLETAKGGTTRGRYLTVWHKNRDGRWCIARNLSLPN